MRLTASSFAVAAADNEDAQEPLGLAYDLEYFAETLRRRAGELREQARANARPVAWTTASLGVIAERHSYVAECARELRKAMRSGDRAEMQDVEQRLTAAIAVTREPL